MTKVVTPAGEAKSRLQVNEGVAMDWLVDDSLVENAGLTVARMTLARNVRTQGHRHPNCSEVIHLIEGTVEQVLGRDRLAMRPGDTVFIPAGCYHQTTNVGDGDATMVVSYSAGTRIYEAEPKAQG